MTTVVFTPEGRSQLRGELLQHASTDARISGAALTGSAALDNEDRWSDIDLAFAVADAAQMSSVLSDWTTLMYKAHEAVGHTDVARGAWVYRVFLLANTLQVDLAFAPASEFRGLAPSFRLMFGRANEPQHAPPPRAADLIGMGWLYALHARSSIARRKWWQAEYMISGVRDHAFALACIRHGLPAVHGRGIDQLPREITAEFEASLVARLDDAELSRAFQVALSRLLGEIEIADSGLAQRLGPTLKRLSDIDVAF